MGKLLPLHRLAGTPAEMSDEALLAACALDDRAALGALFDRYHRPLYRFLLHFLGGAHPDVDDLVQLTFLELRDAAPSYRGQASVRAWIFGIAANLARRHVHRESRRRGLLDRGGPPASAPLSLPDETAERRMLVARLRELVPLLPPDLRAAYVMCDLEGVPGVDAARVLDVREGTLWRRLHEARKMLREMFEGRLP